MAHLATLPLVRLLMWRRFWNTIWWMLERRIGRWDPKPSTGAPSGREVITAASNVNHKKMGTHFSNHLLNVTTLNHLLFQSFLNWRRLKEHNGFHFISAFFWSNKITLKWRRFSWRRLLFSGKKCLNLNGNEGAIDPQCLLVGCREPSRWLTLARLQSLSYGERELREERWREVRQFERLCEARLRVGF